MPTPRPIIDAKIGANVATSKYRATSGSANVVVSATESTAETMGRNAPRIEPNANKRITSATVTPMPSDDGGSPPTLPNTPFAPTCRPSSPFCAFTRFSAAVASATFRSLKDFPLNSTVA